MWSREGDPARRGTRRLMTAQTAAFAASGVAVGLAPSALGDGAHADAGAMLAVLGMAAGLGAFAGGRLIDRGDRDGASPPRTPSTASPAWRWRPRSPRSCGRGSRPLRAGPERALQSGHRAGEEEAHRVGVGPVAQRGRARPTATHEAAKAAV